MFPILGIFLALCGASLLALAMVTQRYALSYPTELVPFGGFTLPKNTVWFAGLVLYGVANGFYAASLLYGPLSLLAGVFTTLLVFNMCFSWYILGEDLTPTRIVGSLLILIGVVCCVAGTPSDVETEFTPQDIIDLLSSVGGSLYVTVLVLIISISILCILWFEARHPAFNSSVHDRSNEFNSTSTLALRENSPITCLGGGEISTDFDQVHITEDPDAKPCSSPTPSSVPSLKPGPSKRLDGAMAVLYPGSLGVDEGLAHLTMKAALSMLDTCKQMNQCGMPVIYIFLVVWIAASIATLWWLRRVFGRYESTKALPVEYGAVNIVSVCSGLLFFRESASMTQWQLSITVLGVIVILFGIGVGKLKFNFAETAEFELEKYKTTVPHAEKAKHGHDHLEIESKS